MKEFKADTCIKIISLGTNILFKTVRLYNKMSSYSDLLESVLPKKEYVPVAGDKIYFIPGCNVPRFKVKKFCESQQVALVKYSKSSNVRIVGIESLKQLVQFHGCKVFNAKEFVRHIRKHSSNSVVYLPLVNEILNSDSEFVLVSHGIETYGTVSIRNFTDLDKMEGDDKPLVYSELEDYEKFQSILIDTNIYHQDEILRRINDGKTLGSTDFISIQRLIKSEDKENLKLAMEVMANSDYEKSCVYLLLLIKKYGKLMELSNTRWHVNFKSLCKFFEIEDLKNIKLDDIIAKLLKRKLLNESNLNKLLPMVLKEYKGNKDDYFVVENLGYKDSIKQGLAENILDRNNNTIVFNEDGDLNPKL